MDDAETLHAFMRRYGFATLVTHRDGSPFATHLPLLLRAGDNGDATLIGHVARANPQWEGFDGTTEALAIFQGPHAYVSPTWYGNETAVPTWNYTAVHAYGCPRAIEDPDRLTAILREMTDFYESPLPRPWSIDRLPETFFMRLAKAVVGFEMEITRLEGKFKLNQNKPEAERERVVAALRETGGVMGGEVAELMSGEGRSGLMRREE